MVAFDIKKGTENSLINEKLVLEYYHNSELDLYSEGGAVQVVVPFNLVSSGSPPSILNPGNIKGNDVEPAKEPKKSYRDALFIALGAFAATFLVFAGIWLCCLSRRCCRKGPSIPVGLLNENEEG